MSNIRIGRLLLTVAITLLLQHFSSLIHPRYFPGNILIKDFALAVGFGWFAKRFCNLGGVGLVLLAIAIPLVGFAEGLLKLPEFPKHVPFGLMCGLMTPSLIVWTILSGLGWRWALRAEEIQSRTSSRRYLLAAGLSILTIILLVAWATFISFPQWENWHKRGGDLRTGMNREEVVREIASHSSRIECNTEDGDEFCQYQPGGFARISLSALMNGLFYFPYTYRINLSFDRSGKLQTWESQTFND